MRGERVCVVGFGMPCIFRCFFPSQSWRPWDTANRTKPHGRATAAAPLPASSLRVTHVSLYKNGVGFFEHEGRVVGDAAVSLDLSSAQLNDVLQTLTAVDTGGGRVTGANYGSTMPLAQQLRTLPLSLGEQPTQQELFGALRGARVEVTGAGPVITGRVLGMEVRALPPPAGTTTVEGSQTSSGERRFLTVVADSGATRTLELTSAVTVRLLEAGLRGDLSTYLELLDRNRTEGVRHLVLTDRGVGTRVMRVSFLSEVPVWKSTYRWLITEGDNAAPEAKATLQGFSVVDNTTGEDWNDVRLSLVAGNPQSFLQSLAQPIYSRRPEVAIAQNAQVTPQTHESGDEAVPVPPPPPGSAWADLNSGVGGGPTSLFGSPTGTGTGGPIDAAERSSGRNPANINAMRDTGAFPPPGALASVAAGADPMLYEQAARASTQANTTTATFDDFFAYNLSEPVTIPRNGSALVPILQEQLPAERVTLWSAAVPRPLRAMWVTNSSSLTLDRGSFSVVENGAFAGEGLMEPVHPGERRLLSYAVDEAVRVSPDTLPETRRITSVTAARGVLHAATSEVDEVRYTVRNAAPVARTVVLEEPRRENWLLDKDLKPAEVTSGVYRYRVVVAAHASAEVRSTQRHVNDQFFQLIDSSEQQLTLYLRGNGVDAAVLAQLEPIFAAKRAIADLDTQIGAVQGKIRAIGDDQKRVRENLQALKGSAEERALVRRYTGELNAQEDTLAGLKRDLAALQGQRTAAAAELDRRIENLQITS